MRKLILLVSFALLAGACIPAGVVVSGGPYYQPPRYYVYSYADGSCWIDDYWYARCPQYYGNEYGYHRYQRGYRHYHPQYRWDYYPNRPPPRTWRHPPPHRGHRYTPPPRVRDHRNHRVPTRPRTRGGGV